MGVSSFLGIRYDAYKNNYKTKDLYQKIYWNNYSDSINELVINSNKQIMENEYKINSIKYQEYIDNIADSLIANNPFHKKVFEHKENFWIIDLKTDSLHGPFQKVDYLAKKKELGVSKKLKLDGE